MTERRYAVIAEYLQKENIGDYVPISLSETVDKALDVEHGCHRNTRPPRSRVSVFNMNPLGSLF